MFTKYFKLDSIPFTENLNAQEMLSDERVKQGLARFEYMAENSNLALLTGQSGVGKTSLLNLYIKTLSKNKYRPIYLNLTSLESNQLLRLVLIKLHEVPGHHNGKEKNFLQILEKINSEEATTILIIDEAQLLKDDALTDLRLLISSEPGKEYKLKILLCGLEDITKTLKSNTHKSLQSRISVRYHLQAFDIDETSNYIDFRIKNAGGSTKIFNEDAKNIIHDYSKGIPRNINNIATAALIHAASIKQQVIDEDIITTVMEEIMAV